jgi:hypothetical protein
MTRVILLLLVSLLPEGARAEPRLVRAKLEPASPKYLSGCNQPTESREENDTSNEPHYKLNLCITARFRSPEFNVGAYLGSLELRASHSEAEDPIVLKSYDARGVRQWLASVSFPRKPQVTQLTVSILGGQWQVEFGAIPWRKTGVAWIANGSAALTLDEPRGVALHSARWLPIHHPDRHLLEIVIENRTTLPVPLSFIKLNAVEPSPVLCWSANGSWPLIRQMQTVSLNWARIINRGTSQGAEGAETFIGRHKVEIETHFRMGGCANDHEFIMRIPVDYVLAPSAFTRLDYEFEDTHEDTDSILGRGFPSSLAHWSKSWVSLEPEEQVFPSLIQIMSAKKTEAVLKENGEDIQN